MPWPRAADGKRCLVRPLERPSNAISASCRAYSPPASRGCNACATAAVANLGPRDQLLGGIT